MAKFRIVCFGDSNTWGYDPDNRTRFPENIRWTGVLQSNLGEDYLVLEEGQNGRTIATDDPAEGEKNGIQYIIPCVESQSPFDLLILMLGSNDLKRKFNYSSMDIAGEMQLMLEKLKSWFYFRMENHPRILLVSPPYIGEQICDSWLGDSFGYENARKVSMELAGWYKQLADMYDCDYIDAAQYVQASATDACHMDAENHRKFAAMITEYVLKHFKIS